MKIIHITPSSNGYEIKTLLANRISRKNSFSLIETPYSGEISMTGGFIINDTPEIRKILDNIPKENQYDFVKSFKVDPWVRTYADEPYGDEPPLQY